MSTPSYLFAPMELNALLVNQQVLGKPFRRWRQQYTQLNVYTSPIPAAFQGEIDANFSSNDANRGVYLHWQVPKSLRQGLAQNATSTPVFPFLPNRWLVVRYFGTGDARKMKAWVLESDCPNDDVVNRTIDSSPYLMDPDILTLWAQSQSPARKAVAQETVPSGQPQPNTVYNVLLGKVFDLATWTEQGISQQFLTAMAPGNTEFAAYQPMVANIYSFHDRVQDDPDVVEGSPLSYLVAGWYSVPGADPLGGFPDGGAQEDFDQLLASLRWQAADGSGTANALITHGLTYNLVWQNTAAPDTQIQDTTNLHVAIGNNALDAFQNMVNQQLADQASGDPTLQQLLDSLPDAAHLLEAFSYDMVYLLDDPGGTVALQNAIRTQWFQPLPGGIRWTVVDENDTALDAQGAAAIAAEAAQEAPWLNQLNADQANYDTLASQLQRAQRDLFGLWWKFMFNDANSVFLNSRGVSKDQFVAALNPANPDGLVFQVNALAAQVQQVAALVPRPIFNTPADSVEVALQNGIDAFMAAKRQAGLLSATRVLKSIVQPSFFAPSDPVMLLSGARTQQQVLDNRLLQVRLPGQLVSAFLDGSLGTVTAPSLGSLLPSLVSSAIPDVLVNLYNEAFLLDPVNAPAIAAQIPGASVGDVQALIAAHAPANFQGTLPGLALQNWTQPWNPLYFEWRINYYPIGALDARNQPNWRFDGNDYRYVGALPDSPTPFNVMGRSIMTSQVSGVFQQRLQAYLSAHPDPGIQAIEDQLNLDNWDFLVQSFTGFNQFLAQSLPANNRIDPTVTISSSSVSSTTVPVQELVSGQTDILPMDVSNSDLQPFQGIRRGQAYVEQMIIYDAFGQALDVVTTSSGLKSSDNFHPILGPELTPDQNIVAFNPWRLFQLPPRLIQPARLSFRLVDAVNPTQYVDTDQTANPVGGWIIPNHLEQGLSLYAADGSSLGLLRLTVGVNGSKAIGWQPAPHASVQTQAQLQVAAPMVAQWMVGLDDAGSGAFEDFLSAIDETLWTVDPIGGRSDQNLSVLIGRPLALTRAQLQFQLKGAPIRDQSWPKTFDSSVPDYTQESFQVRLGEQELRQDGLVGYYLNQDFTLFNNVHQPEGATDSYLKVIGPENFIAMPFDGTTTADVVMLIDPRAAVHAMTGLFPVLSLALPNAFVDPVLSSLEIAFHVAPFLTELVANPDASAGIANAVLIPTPAEQNGAWSWWERSQPAAGDAVWVPLGLKQEGGVADLTPNDKTLRDGFLQLIIDVE